MGVLTGAKPRPEVLKGDLEDAIFAADFGDLIAGDAKPVYQSPTVFFQNTHPAVELCKVVRSVFERLSDSKEPGATMRLSTGFGGGKTHTLMALWHLAKKIQDASLGTELLPAAGRPKSVTVVGIDAGKAGVPLYSSHGRTKVHSLWGEMFHLLGGEAALKSLGKADDSEASPNEKDIEKVFPKGPVLLLFDELVIYMAKLSDRGQGNLLGFLNSLASVVGKRPQTVLVVTDPAKQAAYADESASLAGLKLGEVQSRKVSDFNPIKDEAARVIVRRLFEKIDKVEAQRASASYHTLYERLAQDSPNPEYKRAAGQDYAARIVECYPFHPRLLDTAQDRLGAMQDFQKSRGVLRLFARIIRNAWERTEDLELIAGGEIDWSSARIQADLLGRLQRDEFKAAVSADIEKHARELDGGEGRGIHTRVASALLLESLPLQPNCGLDRTQATIAVLRAEEAGPEAGEALDRLVGVCWHTYPTQDVTGVQFRYEPNIIKQIEERTRDIPVEDAKARVMADAQGYFGGPLFKLAPWPDTASQVQEAAELQLALCESPEIAERVCKYSDDSDPQAPMPRKFRNAIVGIAPTPQSLNEAIWRAQRLMAAEKIERDHRAPESAKLVREQLQRIKPDFQKQFGIQTRRAFDQLYSARGYLGKLEEKYQVPDEQILQQPRGQACVRQFLEDKNLVWKPGTALDVKLFLDKILPGAVPEPGTTDVYSAKAIHERFLAAPDMRLLRDTQVVSQTVVKAVNEGKLVVCIEGRAFDDKGCVDGPAGKRRRTPAPLNSVPLTSDVLMTRAGSAKTKEWLQEDKSGGGKQELPPPPPPPLPATTVDNWDDLVRRAGEEPLVEMRFTAATPAAASNLLALAQPLGADSLSMTVGASGQLRDGGQMNFLAKDVRPNHPTKPLPTAQMIFNALADGSSYEAQLRLTFTGGRTGLAPQLEQVREQAPDEVRVYGRFDIGGTAK